MAENMSSEQERPPTDRRERYKRTLKSQAYWFGGTAIGGCLDRPTRSNPCHDAPPPLAPEEALEVAEVDDGYVVRLDIETGEMAVLPIVDGVVIENADN